MRTVALCRPSEKVFDLLERTPDQFVKEDGAVVAPAPDRRLEGQDYLNSGKG